jgi:heme-degrading monooxygenase HmoA
MVVVLIETLVRADADLDAYHAAGARLEALLDGFPGFLGAQELPPGPDGCEVSLVRFASLDALAAWRDRPVHREIQELGRSSFYERYRVEVLTRVRAYAFTRAGGRVEDHGV